LTTPVSLIRHSPSRTFDSFLQIARGQVVESSNHQFVEIKSSNCWLYKVLYFCFSAGDKVQLVSFCLHDHPNTSMLLPNWRTLRTLLTVELIDLF